ncbi:hypothetical protein MSAR_11540 [Mycolicibacterium sarraceniae]|uniref:HTH gntR-type domain-containing protein n=1 Tax=Mycolicibacterium sarraceniae TaxID=1534348 RepID=A0A7I7SMM2_9MYCO|nr:hypothetical protein MSAR_11540 [Mycolicibacterium sarraceniae]
MVDQPGRRQQAILDELRRVILDGTTSPGTPIPLAEVADLFGVSQIPARESLKTLIGEGGNACRPWALGSAPTGRISPGRQAQLS